MKRKYLICLRDYKNERYPLFFRCFDSQGVALFSTKICFFEKEKAKEIKAMIDIPVKLFSYYVDDEI